MGAGSATAPGVAPGQIGAYTRNYVHMPLMEARDA